MAYSQVAPEPLADSGERYTLDSGWHSRSNHPDDGRTDLTSSPTPLTAISGTASQERRLTALTRGPRRRRLERLRRHGRGAGVVRWRHGCGRHHRSSDAGRAGAAVRWAEEAVTAGKPDARAALALVGWRWKHRPRTLAGAWRRAPETACELVGVTKQGVPSLRTSFRPVRAVCRPLAGLFGEEDRRRAA